MNYFTYLFSDRKAIKYWGILLFVVVVLAVIAVFANYNGNITQLTSICFHISFVLILFIGFYSTSFLNYMKQIQFLKLYSNRIDHSSFQKSEVELYFSTYNMQTVKTNFTAKIKPKSKFEIFETFRIDDKIGILGHTYDLGVLKRHIPPIIIDTENNKSLIKYKFTKSPKLSFINCSENDIEIVFKRNFYGIDKIKLIGCRFDMKVNNN